MKEKMENKMTDDELFDAGVKLLELMADRMKDETLTAKVDYICILNGIVRDAEECIQKNIHPEFVTTANKILEHVSELAVYNTKHSEVIIPFQDLVTMIKPLADKFDNLLRGADLEKRREIRERNEYERLKAKFEKESEK